MTPRETEGGDRLMTAHDDVVSDLRKLRRRKSRNTMDYKNAPHLVWHTGRGNIEVTARFLSALRNLNDIEILAALASIGFGSPNSNVEDRMNQFAARHNEESTRTVRRWAEEGFTKIADLVMEWSEEEANDKALVEILLHQTEATRLNIFVTASGLPEMTMFAPVVKTNGKETEIQPAQGPKGDPSVFYRSTVVTDLSNATSTAARLEIEWLGNTGTYYEVQVHPSIRDYVTASIVTKKGCEIALFTAGSMPLADDPIEPRWKIITHDNATID